VHKHSGEQVAIKVIDKSSLSDEALCRIHTECEVQSKLNHPNIAQLLNAMESTTHVFMVMEYAAGGEFLEFLNQHGRFEEAEARELFGFLVDALEYAHNAGYVNRDIKLDNILIKDGRLLVSDWGFATSWHQNKRINESIGSRNYCCPEIASGTSYIGPEADVWSLGVVLYALVNARLPFHSLSDIRMGEFYMPERLSEELQALLRSMLCVDPAKRATVASVKNSAWMRLHASTPTAASLPPEQCSANSGAK
jgi:serine/threonine protein kinase